MSEDRIVRIINGMVSGAFMIGSMYFGIQLGEKRENDRVEAAHVAHATAQSATPIDAYGCVTGTDGTYDISCASVQIGNQPVTVRYDLLKEFNSDSLEHVVTTLAQKAQAKQPVTMYTTEIDGQVYLVKVTADGQDIGLQQR